MTEADLVETLDLSGRVLLVEPPYKRKYPPLGLAKISSYLKSRGKQVHYTRNLRAPFDPNVILLTSLFTTSGDDVYNTIDEALMTYPRAGMFLGGVFATLCEKEIKQKYGGRVAVFSGYSKVLDKCIPDYLTDWGVEDPWDSFSFTFTSRGCPNRCPYCAVWRIEPEMWICHNWRDHIAVDKPNAMISDNNLSAIPEHLVDVCAFLAEKKKKAVFDNGLDCKHITPEIANALKKVSFIRSGLRLAFDRIEEDGVFQSAIEMLKAHGISKSNLMAYVLFNFNDTPQEANYRMSECVRVGVRPYPQKYEPLYDKNAKAFIGKHWTKNLARAFRFFWLMAGIYQNNTFEKWAKSQDKYPMTEKDWEAWYGEKRDSSNPNSGGLEGEVEEGRNGIDVVRKDRPSPDAEGAGLEGRDTARAGCPDGRDTERPVGSQRKDQGESWDIPWIEVATRFCRVDDGLPAWVHSRRVARLKALGNAIVPQVAHQIIKAIAQVERGQVA